MRIQKKQKKKKKRKRKGRKKRGPAIGQAKPTHHIEKGVKDYEPTFFNECDKFVDNLLGV